MPIYEYSCSKCGNEFEALVMNNDPPCCPVCGSKELEKLMATFAHRTGGSDHSSSSASKCSGCAGKTCSTCH